MPRLTLPVLLLLALALPREARAGACNDEVVTRITMSPGRACWLYRGSATTFVGAFGFRQQIVAHMKGQAAEYDPRTGGTRSSIQNREPYAEGPGKFYAAGENGMLAFTTPASGTYRFGFSPCAMWGAPGTVEICAR